MRTVASWQARALMKLLFHSIPGAMRPVPLDRGANKSRFGAVMGILIGVVGHSHSQCLQGTGAAFRS